MTTTAIETYETELPRFDRVRKSSPGRVNRRIDAMTEARIEEFRTKPLIEVRARIAELEREWDVDRILMAVFAVVGGTTFLLGEKVNRKWLALFSVQMGFLLYHSVKGWCPPVSVLRRLGFRTVREIEAEKSALESFLGNPHLAI